MWSSAASGALVFVWGAVLGSFANVVIYRAPKGLSTVSPGSACPHCGRKLPWSENIPLFSYLFLRGRCRGCRRHVSFRYPVVEALVGGLWVAAAMRVGLRSELPAFLAFVTVLVVLGAIDLETRRIPNKVLGPAALVAALLLGVATVVSGHLEPLGRATVGGLAYGAPMLGLALAVPAGMGMGDVKFAAYLGLHLGWVGLLHVAVGAFAGFFIGASAGVLLMVLGKKGRKSTLPFGPSMAAGALVALFAGDPILKAWLG